MTRPPKPKAIERLKRALDQILDLKELSTDSPEFDKWRRNTEIAIENIFGEDGRHIKDFTRIYYVPLLISSDTLTSEWQEHYATGLDSAASVLKSMIEEIEEWWEDEDDVKFSGSPPKDERIDSSKVFIVHGRDEGTKSLVARFLAKLELEPVILDEQADKGRTIIEKFEGHAQEVRFAVVLLTPDDEGALQGEESDLKPRARQNVIFELGYFAGSLGRNRVCAITKGDVEIPSDYDGVIYIPLDDSGGWKLRLVKELKAAGFDVDANLAL